MGNKKKQRNDLASSRKTASRSTAGSKGGKGTAGNSSGPAAGAPSAMPRRLFVAGIVFAAAACIASLMLTISHLGGMELPGCGEGSGCDALSRSVWGKVPVLKWPVAHVGVAYFAAVLFGWLRASGPLGLLQQIIRLGAVLSLAFLCLMFFVEKHFCMYCFVAHLANFGLLAVSEAGAGRWPVMSSKRPMWVVAGVFVLFTAALAGVNTYYAGKAEKKAQEQRSQSLQNITGGGGQGGDASRWGPNGFTGRWLIGPEAAPIRIVMLTDYQCPDCKRIETEAMSLVRSRNDVSLSIKHFPMATDCNKYAGRTLHANACWAARAAEAAGMLGGNDAFWKMSEWLYANDGKFETAQTLAPIVADMRLNLQEFISTMSSEAVLPGILREIDEGKELGLFYTPMVFINGVEMKGIFMRNALTSAVVELAAKNLPAVTSINDNPVLAPTRYIQDWQDERARQLPPDGVQHTYGPRNAKVQIVMWGDLQADPCRAADRKIRAIVNELDDVSYTYRHYPFDLDCNPHLDAQTPQNEFGCQAARAVEAAAQLGGEVKYWEMHDKLVTQPALARDPQRMSEVVKSLGLNAASFETMFNDQAVTNAILDDCNAGERVGLRQIPWVFVNNKRVPRWDDVDGSPTMRRIVELALEEAKAAEAPSTP